MAGDMADALDLLLTGKLKSLFDKIFSSLS